MDFKINEIVIYNGIEAEIIATQAELIKEAKIKLTINDMVVKELSYSGNFDYLIVTNRKNSNDIGNLTFVTRDEIEKK